MRLTVKIETQGKYFERSLTYPGTIDKWDQDTLMKDSKMLIVQLYLQAYMDLMGWETADSKFEKEAHNEEALKEYDDENKADNRRK
jgi:hypothetical protein